MVRSLWFTDMPACITTPGKKKKKIVLSNWQGGSWFCCSKNIQSHLPFSRLPEKLDEYSLSILKSCSPIISRHLYLQIHSTDLKLIPAFLSQNALIGQSAQLANVETRKCLCHALIA